MLLIFFQNLFLRILSGCVVFITVGFPVNFTSAIYFFLEVHSMTYVFCMSAWIFFCIFIAVCLFTVFFFSVTQIPDCLFLLYRLPHPAFSSPLSSGSLGFRNLSVFTFKAPQMIVYSSNLLLLFLLSWYNLNKKSEVLIVKETISITTYSDNRNTTEEVELANTCPICGVTLSPCVISGVLIDHEDEEDNKIFLLNFCPKCEECFISKHIFDIDFGEGYIFSSSSPQTPFGDERALKK